jgi:hypothetical protein
MKSPKKKIFICRVLEVMKGMFGNAAVAAFSKN